MTEQMQFDDSFFAYFALPEINYKIDLFLHTVLGTQPRFNERKNLIKAIIESLLYCHNTF